MSETLLVDHRDGVDWVTLNRPDSLNALSPELIDALNAYFGQLQRNRFNQRFVIVVMTEEDSVSHRFP